MPRLETVDYDPFAPSGSEGGGDKPQYRLETVDYDPFAEPAADTQDVQPSSPAPEDKSSWEFTPVGDFGEDFMEDSQPVDKKSLAQTASDLYHPVLSTAGLLGGAAAGGVAGIPGGPAGVIIGGTLGAGPGYALGESISNTLDILTGLRKSPETMGEAAENIAAGMLMQGTGGILAKAVQPVIAQGGKVMLQRVGGAMVGAGVGGYTGGEKGAVVGAVAGAALGPAGFRVAKGATRVGAEKNAGKLLAAVLNDDSAIIARNVQEARALEKKIPGLTFDLAQQTNDPSVISTFRAKVKAGTKEAALEYKERAMRNTRAVLDHYADIFPESEGVSDVMDAIRARQAKLATSAQGAEQLAQKEASAVGGMGPDRVGQEIVDALSGIKAAAKRTAGDLYAQVPDMKVPIEDMLGKFRAVNTPLYAGEKAANFPNLLERVQRTVGQRVQRQSLTDAIMGRPPQSPPRELELHDLIGMRQELLADARAAMKGATPNEYLGKRLYQAADAIEQTISSVEGDTGAAAMLKRANAFYRENVVPLRQGNIGKIMGKGANGEPIQVQVSKVPTLIWGKGNLSTADKFIDVLGFDNARAVMKDHAAYELMSKAKSWDGKISTAKLKGWLGDNQASLKRFGLEHTFDDVVKAQELADAASQVATEYEKTVAGRILNTDPKAAIGVALSTNRTAASMRLLMDTVKGNTAAENGLRKAMGDYVMDNIQRTAKGLTSGDIKLSNDAFVKLMRKYDPAMQELYRSQPAKLQALKDIQKAHEIMIRNESSAFGGGSDTTELAARVSKFNVLNRAASISRGVYNMLQSHGEKLADEYLVRAMFNPDYAWTLKSGSKGTVDPRALSDTINRQMAEMRMALHEQYTRAAAGVFSTAAGTIGRQ